MEYNFKYQFIWSDVKLSQSGKDKVVDWVSNKEITYWKARQISKNTTALLFKKYLFGTLLFKLKFLELSNIEQIQLMVHSTC